MKVDYSDIFISPWCCDSSHEDRYESLVQQMRELELDPTTVVLLSVKNGSARGVAEHGGGEHQGAAIAEQGLHEPGPTHRGQRLYALVAR